MAQQIADQIEQVLVEGWITVNGARIMINDETGEVEGGPKGLEGKRFDKATSQGLADLRRSRGEKGTLGDRAKRVEAETKNPGRGYHGELQTTKHLGKSEDDPAIKADYAKAHSWLKANAPAGHSDEELRVFLDSSAGRHFADTVARSGGDLNKVNPKEVFNSAFRSVVKAHRSEQQESQDTQKAAEIRRHVEEKTPGTPAQKEFHIARVQHKNGLGPEPGHEELHKKFDEIDKTSRAHIEKNFGHLPKADQERQIERISNKQKMALAPKASSDDPTQAARASNNDKTLQGDPGLNARLAQEKRDQHSGMINDAQDRINNNSWALNAKPGMWTQRQIDDAKAVHDQAKVDIAHHLYAAGRTTEKPAGHEEWLKGLQGNPTKRYQGTADRPLRDHDKISTTAVKTISRVAKTATNKAVEASSKATAATTDIDRMNSHKAAKEAHAIASIAARQAGDHKTAETHEKAVKDHTALEDRFTKKVRKRFPG
jgi:hypothetical protein